MPDNRRWVLEHEHYRAKHFPVPPIRTWHYFHEDYKPALCGMNPIPGTPLVGEEPYLLVGQPIMLCEKCYLERMKQLGELKMGESPDKTIVTRAGVHPIIEDLRRQIRVKDTLIQQLKDDNSRLSDSCTAYHDKGSEILEALNKLVSEFLNEEGNSDIGIANCIKELALSAAHKQGALNKVREENNQLKGNVANLVKALEQQSPRSLKSFIAEVMDWAKTKGWEPDDKRTFGDECTLLHTEISEAFEAWRKRGFESWTETDKNGIEKPEGVPSEFADLFIRLCHYCGAHNIDLEEWFDRKMAYNQKREYRHGGKRA